MTDASHMDQTVRLIAEKADGLDPQIERQTAVAEDALRELAQLLEEQRTLRGAIDSLLGNRPAVPVDERTPWRGGEPVFRVHRALREMEMLRRQRDPDADIVPRRLGTSSSLPARKRRGSPRGNSASSVEALALEFAATHDGTVQLRELAEIVLREQPHRYRDATTAKASLYHHLGKSEKFEKVGSGAFRLLEQPGRITEKGESRMPEK